MFERAVKNLDIEKMDILYKDSEKMDSTDVVAEETVYFPYEAIDSDRIDNAYQSSFISKENNLYIVIDKNKKAEEKAKAVLETEKAAQKPINDKKERKNKDKKNRTPIEFGSAEDLLQTQAMNYFKGITQPPEKKDTKTES